jgi:hypothetical protein
MQGRNAELLGDAQRHVLEPRWRSGLVPLNRATLASWLCSRSLQCGSRSWSGGRSARASSRRRRRRTRFAASGRRARRARTSPVADASRAAGRGPARPADYHSRGNF